MALVPRIKLRDTEEIRNLPSCRTRTASENLKTQIALTEEYRFGLLTEPNQEIQLDFAGPIKYKTRGDVYNLVAIDRFSKWPTGQNCKNTDTQTVLKSLTDDCSDNGTPRTIRTGQLSF